MATSMLSSRGQRDAATMQGRAGIFKEILRNQYDKDTNPEGYVVLGIADNSLCRKELVQFFTSPGRLVLEPRDLTYADSFFASFRVLTAICDLYNEVPDGLYTEQSWSRPLTPVEPDHLIIGNGATEIIEAVSWALCDPGDGILLSEPYYNAFDEDVKLRAGVEIVPVQSPVPSPSLSGEEPVACFAESTIASYGEALLRATKNGTKVRAIFVCNPHNPTGCIYPRKMVVALAKFAAANSLHLVMDEIYARSVFPTATVPHPTPFDSILRIDTAKEAGLHPSQVHVIGSASKDFSINGFRIGIFISQHNKPLIDALTATARFAQTASPAGQLFASLLNDRKYLTWFLEENRRRLTKAYEYVIGFCQHHQLPFVPSNAGHFLLIDFRRFLHADIGVSPDTTQLAPGEKPMTPERDLTDRFLQGKVFVAPGAQYHHPTPGIFRLTFSIDPNTLRIGLSRMEKVLRLKPWIDSQNMPDFA